MIKKVLTLKILFMVVVLLLPVALFAADRYSVATGNWNSTSTWSATSGGVSGASFPVAGDNVYIENGHTVTVTANEACSNISFTGISATLTVNSGFTLTVSGIITLLKQSSVSSACSITGAGTISCANITVGTTANAPSGINNTYTFTMSCTIQAINITNNLTVNSYYTGAAVKAAGNGVFAAGSGVITVSGTVVTIAEGGNKNEVTFTLAAGAGTASLVLTGATPFNIDSQGSIVNLDGTSSLVNYSFVGAQTLYNAIYTNITVSGSGTKTIGNPGTVTVNGLLSMEGTATIGGKSPTFGANATLQYKGSASQTAGLEFPTTFSASGGVIIDNSNGLTLTANRTINSLLNFINGKISTAANTLILGPVATVSGAGSGKYVYGNLQKGVATGTSSKNFEIGDASVYAPISLSFTGTISTAGSITANSVSGDHPNINTSAFNAAATVNRYWTLTNSGVAGFTSYSATFTFVAGDLDAGTDYNYFNAGIYSAAAWSYPVVGTKTSVSTQATGLTLFGAFQIGHLMSDYRSATTGNWDQASTWEYFSGGLWVAAIGAPTSSSGAVTVLATHTVTVNSSVTVDQVVVEASADLVLNSDMTLADGTGDDLTINGTIELVGTATLTGSGSFVLSSDANILIGSPDGISASGPTGNVQTSTRSFSQSANYYYNGTSAQITGDGLPFTVNNLTINNSTGATLSASVTVEGTLDLISGGFAIGSNTLTLQTSDIPISRTSGTISTSASSNLVFGSPGNTGGASFSIPSGTFTSAPTINNLTIYRANGITLNDQIMSVGGIVLCNGPLNSNNNILLLSDAVQTALIDGSGTGSVSGNVTMQRYLASGFGYKYISSPFQAATVNEFADDITLGSYTFFRYDETRTSSGWVSYHTPTTNPLNPLEGYAVNFGAVDVPNTVDITGNVNNGSLSVTLYNNNNTYTQGFNLVGNPYPSPIDWDAATGWTKSGIDDAVHYFKASTTDQYGGTYSSYVNGVSSDGLATNVIPSMQGFFVHVTDGSYPVTGTLGMDNNIRITDLTHSFIKSKGTYPVPLLRLVASFSDDPLSTDPVLIYFDYKGSPEFDSQLDALKLLNTDFAVPNLYAVTPSGKKLSINALPPISDDFCTVPLGLKLNKTGNIIIKIRDIDESLSGMRIYLSDLITGTENELLPDKEFTLSLGIGEYLNRFFLNFSNITTDIFDTSPVEDIFNIYSYRGLLKADIKILQEKVGTIRLYNLTGQVLFIEKIYETGYHEFNPGLKDGIYIVSYISGTERISKKIIIQN